MLQRRGDAENAANLEQANGSPRLNAAASSSRLGWVMRVLGFKRPQPPAAGEEGSSPSATKRRRVEIDTGSPVEWVPVFPPFASQPSRPAVHLEAPLFSVARAQTALNEPGPSCAQLGQVGEAANAAKDVCRQEQQIKDAPDWEALLIELYKRKNPEKCQDVATLLEKYRGHEEVLYQRVCAKYGQNALAEARTDRSAAAQRGEQGRGLCLETNAASHDPSASPPGSDAHVAPSQTGKNKRWSHLSPLSTGVLLQEKENFKDSECQNVKLSQEQISCWGLSQDDVEGSAKRSQTPSAAKTSCPAVGQVVARGELPNSQRADEQRGRPSVSKQVQLPHQLPSQGVSPATKRDFVAPASSSKAGTPCGGVATTTCGSSSKSTPAPGAAATAKTSKDRPNWVQVKGSWVKVSPAAEPGVGAAPTAKTPQLLPSQSRQGQQYQSPSHLQACHSSLDAQARGRSVKPAPMAFSYHEGSQAVAP